MAGEVEYRVEIKPQAVRDLERLPAEPRGRVWERIRGLRQNLTGDVKRLTNFAPRYRLRVGDYRVLFDVVGSAVIIYRVVHRRNAYR